MLCIWPNWAAPHACSFIISFSMALNLFELVDHLHPRLCVWSAKNKPARHLFCWILRPYLSTLIQAIMDNQNPVYCTCTVYSWYNTVIFLAYVVFSIGKPVLLARIQLFLIYIFRICYVHIKSFVLKQFLAYCNATVTQWKEPCDNYDLPYLSSFALSLERVFLQCSFPNRSELFEILQIIRGKGSIR